MSILFLLCLLPFIFNAPDIESCQHSTEICTGEDFVYPKGLDPTKPIKHYLMETVCQIDDDGEEICNFRPLNIDWNQTMTNDETSGWVCFAGCAGALTGAVATCIANGVTSIFGIIRCAKAARSAVKKCVCCKRKYRDECQQDDFDFEQVSN